MDTPNSILNATAHRPWALPAGPWTMRQTWHDLLFAHWPVPLEQVQSRIPAELRVDEFRDWAWIGIVPFWMSGIRSRLLPPIPTAHCFPELNVRTYVTVNGKPGVYFFSLDAASLLAVIGARIGFGLPYYWAAMQSTSDADGNIAYRSHRRGGAAQAALVASYGPMARPEDRSATDTPIAGNGALQSPPPAESLEYFLTERYCLYVVDKRRRIWRTDIHHLPWPLEPAWARFEANRMAEANGLTLPNLPPVLHFSRKLDVLVWPPRME